MFVCKGVETQACTNSIENQYLFLFAEAPNLHKHQIIHFSTICFPTLFFKILKKALKQLLIRIIGHNNPEIIVILQALSLSGIHRSKLFKNLNA